MRAPRVLIGFVIGAVGLAACSGTTTSTPTPTLAPGATATPAASATSAATATSGTPSATPSLAPTAAATPSPAPSAAATPTLAPPPATASPVPVVTATPLPTPGPVVIGPASMVAPDSIPADTVFLVDWVGPNNTGDYITIMLASKRKWTGEPFFYAYGGTPRTLQSSTTPGAYEIRYINGANSKVLARRPITVTEFVGSLDGPPNVGAGKHFDVAWTGPASPGDYVTIVAAGATQWTNESYFYLNPSHIGTLTAPLTAGSHEIWYVAGDKTVMLREPITVDPLQASVSGPASVVQATNFAVSWTGPDASGDFITIVEVGAAEGSYLSYAYTQYGNPATLTAPTAPGQYELRYVYGSSRETIAVATIQVQ